MPLIPGQIADQIATRIAANIRGKNPTAVVTPFQADIASACANGFVNALTQLAIGVGGVGPPAAGPGQGISNVRSDTMVLAGRAYMVQNAGSEGSALADLLDGIYSPMVDALSQVMVTSVSGFGGQCTSITGITIGAVAQLILAAFPADARSKLLNSSAGKILIEAIANGFATQISSSGIPGPIPVGTGTPGPTVAKFS
jgi:hypothetical protein